MQRSRFIGSAASWATIFSVSFAFAEPLVIESGDTVRIVRFQVDVLNMSDEALRAMEQLLQIPDTTIQREMPPERDPLPATEAGTMAPLERVAVLERSALEHEPPARKFDAFLRENGVVVIAKPRMVVVVDCRGELEPTSAKLRRLNEPRAESPLKSPWRLIASPTKTDTGRIHVDLQFDFKPLGADSKPRRIKVDEELESDQTLILTGNGASGDQRIVMVLTASLIEKPLEKKSLPRKATSERGAGVSAPTILIPTMRREEVPFSRF